MRVLCVARHHYLSEHLCRFFEQLDIATLPCVGLRDAMQAIPAYEPDAVICDYDLLATAPLEDWENDPALNGVPIVAVSLTRHPGEAHVMDVNAIAGFLYLPTLDLDDARRLLTRVRRDRGAAASPASSVSSVSSNALPWPGTSPLAQLR